MIYSYTAIFDFVRMRKRSLDLIRFQCEVDHFADVTLGFSVTGAAFLALLQTLAELKVFQASPQVSLEGG